MQKPIKLIPAIKKAFKTIFTNESLGYMVKVTLIFSVIMGAFVFLVYLLQIAFLAPAYKSFDLGNSTNKTYNDYDMYDYDDTYKGMPLNPTAPSLDSSVVLNPPKIPTSLLTGGIVIILIFFLAFVLYMTWVSVVMTYVPINIHRANFMPLKELMKKSFRKTPKFFLLGILTTVVIAFMYLLLIIPGIIFTIKYLFAPFILLEEDIGPIAAMKKSSQITKGYRFNLFWKGVGFTFLMVLVSLPLIMINYSLGSVGAMIITGFFYLILLTVMDDIKKLKEPQVAQPALDDLSSDTVFKPIEQSIPPAPEPDIPVPPTPEPQVTEPTQNI